MMTFGQMQGSGLKVGQKVYFGRPSGEKTLGVVVKLNPSKAKIRTLEGRGSKSVAGVEWGVPYSMITPAGDDASAAVPASPLSLEVRSLVARYGLQAVLAELQGAA